MKPKTNSGAAWRAMMKREIRLRAQAMEIQDLFVPSEGIVFEDFTPWSLTAECRALPWVQPT